MNRAFKPFFQFSRILLEDDDDHTDDVGDDDDGDDDDDDHDNPIELFQKRGKWWELIVPLLYDFLELFDVT